MLPVALPFNLLSAGMFMIKEPASPLENVWRNGVIRIHLGAALLMLVYFLVLLYIRKTGRIGRRTDFFTYLIVLTILAEASVLVAVDQYVTTNITPFLVICTIMGVLFLIRPGISISIFLFAFVLFSIGIHVAQSRPDIVLTNQVNGLASAGIGISLSLIMWYGNKKNILQARKIQEQQEALQRINLELEKLSITDDLTGLNNRRFFNRSIKNEIERHRRSGKALSLLLMDIDHFKLFNDNLGHHEGDECLRKVAAVIRESAARPFDVAARYGGEEFAVILPYTDMNGARKVAQHLQENLEKAAIFHPNSPTAERITLSIGIAVIVPGRKSSAEDFIRCADAAMYRGKKEGRNCIREGSCPHHVTV